MDPMFFFPVGPGSPKLIGPVGKNISGFPNPPLDPSLQLRFDIRGSPVDKDLRRQIYVCNALSQKRMRKEPKSLRPLPRHKKITTVEPLKVGDEHGKPASPRDLEHRDAFDALEYSPRYLLEEGNHLRKKLPRPLTRGEKIKGANEALDVLEDTFMVTLEPTSAR